MQVSKQKILEYNDADLGLIATADAGTYPDDVVLAVWEELAARGVVVEFMEQAMVPGETPSEDLAAQRLRSVLGMLNSLEVKVLCPT
jgi:hypothetical protein